MESEPMPRRVTRSVTRRRANDKQPTEMHLTPEKPSQKNLNPHHQDGNTKLWDLKRKLRLISIKSKPDSSKPEKRKSSCDEDYEESVRVGKKVQVSYGVKDSKPTSDKVPPPGGLITPPEKQRMQWNGDTSDSTIDSDNEKNVDSDKDSESDNDDIPLPKILRTTQSAVAPLTISTLGPAQPIAAVINPTVQLGTSNNPNLSVPSTTLPAKPIDNATPTNNPQSTTAPKKAVSRDAVHFLHAIYPRRFTTSSYSRRFTAELLPTLSEDYANIKDYIVNSQAHNFGVKLLSALKISRPVEETARANSHDFKMMLFHGTSDINVASILENGFRCPIDGMQMFGQGCYFADRVTKSAQYCVTHGVPPEGSTGHIFLCQVQLGKIYNARLANNGFKSPPTATSKVGTVLTFDSVKGTGANVPNRDRQRMIDGVAWPLGPTVANKKFPSYTVNYNEFVVYDPDRVKLRYLIKVQFKDRPFFNYDGGWDWLWRHFYG